MKAKNITHEEESAITIEHINGLLAQIEDNSDDTWIGDDDFDINVYDNEYYGDGEKGYKYTVYRVVDGDTDVSVWIAHGDIELN